MADNLTGRTLAGEVGFSVGTTLVLCSGMEI